MPKTFLKLKTDGGFTLVEMLAAVVLLGFLILVVGAGTNVAIKVYNEAIQYAESRTISSTALSAMENEIRFAYDIKTSDSGAISGFTSSQYGEDARFELKDGMIQVVSRVGETPLLGKKVYAGGLRIDSFSVTVNSTPVPYGQMVTVNIKMNDGSNVTAEILNVNG